MAPCRYSNRSGIELREQQQRVQRGRGRARDGEQLVERRVAGRVVGLEQELAAGLAIGGLAQRLPGRAAAARPGSVATRARTSIVSCRCGPRDLELDDLGPEVVAVAVQAGLRRPAAR